MKREGREGRGMKEAGERKGRRGRVVGLRKREEGRGRRETRKK